MLVLLLVVFLVWTAVEGVRLLSASRSVQRQAPLAVRALEARDWPGVARATAQADRDAGRFDAAAGSPPLRLLSHVPGIGADVHAVRESAAALHQVTRAAAPLTAQVARTPPPSLVVAGRVDVRRLRALAPAATATAAAVDAADHRLAQLRTDPLHGPVERRVLRLRQTLDAVQPRTRVAAEATTQGPALLGADGPRTYFLAFQNPAEARPTGGIVGAYGVMRATDGQLRLVRSGKNTDFTKLRPADLADVPADVRATYGSDLLETQNVDLSPDFPTGARLLQRMWQRDGHQRVDGVLSVDPAVLAGLLRATGPLTVAGQHLTAQNAQDVLMNRAYADLGGSTPARSRFLEQAVGAVFGRLPATGSAGFQALATPAVRTHVLAWSDRPAEQAFLVDAGLSGALPAPTTGTVGVYTTNADASKLDYFTRTSVSAAGCSSGQTLTVRLRNDSPPVVPAYSTNKLAGAVPTTHTLVLTLLLPPDRGLAGVTLDGRPVGLATGHDHGWTLARLTVTVPRARTATVVARLTGAGTPVTAVRTQPAAVPAAVRLADCP